MSIISQNAGNTAAVLVAAIVAATGEGGVAAVMEMFDAIREEVFSGTMRLAGSMTTTSTAGAVAQVHQAFPGSQAVASDSGAGAYVVGFGKHKGKTLGAIQAIPKDHTGRNSGASWLDWALDKSSDEDLKRAITAFRAA